MSMPRAWRRRDQPRDGPHTLGPARRGRVVTAMRFHLTGDDDPPPRPLPSYRTTARALSDRLLAIVRPIRVLDAVRWDESVGRTFLAAGGRDLPSIDRDSYRPLRFDVATKRRELLDLEREADRRLGRGDPLDRLL